MHSCFPACVCVLSFIACPSSGRGQANIKARTFIVRPTCSPPLPLFLGLLWQSTGSQNFYFIGPPRFRPFCKEGEVIRSWPSTLATEIHLRCVIQRGYDVTAAKYLSKDLFEEWDDLRQPSAYVWAPAVVVIDAPMSRYPIK